MSHLIRLLPLELESHTNALTRLYRASPGYRTLHNLTGNPYQQAQHDLTAVAATPGRAMLGIVRAADPADPSNGAELVGLIDFRRDWPDAGVVYVGLILVADAWQRQGVASQAWGLLEPWLAEGAAMAVARCGVEQFNPGALRFMQHLGFQLTGEAARVRQGERLIRLLTMEKALKQPLA